MRQSEARLSGASSLRAPDASDMPRRPSRGDGGRQGRAELGSATFLTLRTGRPPQSASSLTCLAPPPRRVGVRATLHSNAEQNQRGRMACSVQDAGRAELTELPIR